MFGMSRMVMALSMMPMRSAPTITLRMPPLPARKPDAADHHHQHDVVEQASN